MPRTELAIAGRAIPRGDRTEIEVPLSRLPSGTPVPMPVTVLRGREDGPVVLVCAAIHGDEVNGVEILRRVLQRVRPEDLAGTLVAAPVVNLLGFLEGSRYLPDRRDLNRHFPGLPGGSLASRVAHIFVQEVLSHATHCIDLHTGSQMRDNLPQVRARLSDGATRRLAEAFGAPAMVDSAEIEGSLRETCTERGIPVLCYEGGEPNRFGIAAVEAGTAGVLRVLAATGLWRAMPPLPEGPSLAIHATRWLRAPRSGICRLQVELGEWVAAGRVLAAIGDLYSEEDEMLVADRDGLVLGRSLDPLQHGGDAVVHLGIPGAA